MKILITGASGMLGTDLAECLGHSHELVLTDVVGAARHLDVTDTDEVVRTLQDVRPDLVIHAAAYTDVDGCETDADRAFLVNALGTWNIAAACRDLGAAVIYVSTDYVFDGAKSEAYTEYDAPNPLSRYGQSKLAGEQHVRALVGRHYIVRTAWLYGEGGKSFPKTIIEKSRTEKEIAVVADQIGSPAYTRDLAVAIGGLVGSPLFGTYHMVNTGECSWYDLAREVLALAGRCDVSVRPITSAEWSASAPRPRYSVLRNYAFELQGRKQLRPWRDALADFISRLCK